MSCCSRAGDGEERDASLPTRTRALQDRQSASQMERGEKGNLRGTWKVFLRDVGGVGGKEEDPGKKGRALGQRRALFL